MIAMAGSERQARPGSTLLESTSANWYGTAWPNINHVYIYICTVLLQRCNLFVMHLCRI